jgi:hypothetical protein
MSIHSRYVLISVLAMLVLFSGVIASEGDRENDRKGDSKAVTIPAAEPKPVTTPAAEPKPADLAVPASPVPTLPSVAAPEAGEQIKWQVIAAGGTIEAISTGYRLSGTVAQTSVVYGESDNYGLGGGFWQVFETGSTGCCVGRVGDANGTGEYPDEVTLGDIMLMVDVLFISNDCTKLACPDEADVNQSGGANPLQSACLDYVSLGDIMTLVDFLFITGPETAVLPDCL